MSTPPSFSSSPYTYIKDSKDFENIVALGNPALPILKKMLDESNNNGLIEYIYAIAIEKISKVDIREEQIGIPHRMAGKLLGRVSTT